MEEIYYVKDLIAKLEKAIKLAKNQHRVEVYNMGGRKKNGSQTKPIGNFFEVSSFEKETYFVAISTDVGETGKQLIVN